MPVRTVTKPRPKAPSELAEKVKPAEPVVEEEAEEEDEYVPPPDFSDEYQPPPPPHEKAIPDALSQSAATMLVKGIKVIHGKAADATGYEKFRLDADEEDLWQFMADELIPLLPVRWAFVLICAMMLAILEGSKIAGYLKREADKAALERELRGARA